jgi:hypothetical protein
METAAPDNSWRKCSSCKKSIALGATYFACSVSTCNSPRTGYVFCSVHCFERHLPGARHKDAGAIEKKAPATAAQAAAAAATQAPQTALPSEARPPARVFASSPNSASATKSPASSVPREVLVIASRLKEYIAARSEYSTSGSVMDVLSEHLRVVCDRAIDNARAEGRKTVMDRDFEFLKGR